MISVKWFWMLLLTAVMGVSSSCSLIPPDRRPELPIPPQWHSPKGVSPSGDGRSKGDKAECDCAEVSICSPEIPWSQFFHSAHLRHLIRVGLRENRDLRVAMLNVLAARDLYWVQRAELFPSVDVGGTSSRIQRTSAEETNGQKGRSLTSRVFAGINSPSYVFDLFGRVQSESAAAAESYLASAYGGTTAQCTLIATIANAYFTLLADRKILQLAHETVVAQQRSYDLIDASYQHGIVSKLDVAQIQNALESAKANEIIFERNVELDKNALMMLIGVFDDALVATEETLDEMRVMEVLPACLDSSVLLKRPDIRQAEHLLRSANANIGAARAAFFPEISLTGNYGFASRELSQLFTGAAFGAWSFVPSVTLPIFNGGRLCAQLDYSKVQRSIALQQYENAIQNAFREVADELISRKTLSEQSKTLQRLVSANQEAYTLSYSRYKLGLDSFLPALIAQRTLFASQKEAIAVELLQLVNLVNLYLALGGGVCE